METEMGTELQLPTEHDLAYITAQLCRKHLVCIDTKSNHGGWYQFQDHLWRRIDNDQANNIIIDNFMKVIDEYMKCLMPTFMDDHNRYTEAKTFIKAYEKYRSNAYQQLRFVKIAKHLLYDKTFYDKLDINRNLLGFNNGVYDLASGLFRDGCPEDYVSLSVGYNYEFLKRPLAIENYFNEKCSDPDDLNYVLLLLSTFLDGHNPLHHFHIWIRDDSDLIRILMRTLGQYADFLPDSYLTENHNSVAIHDSFSRRGIYNTKGKRLVVIESHKDPLKIKNAQISNLTSNDWICGLNVPLFLPQFKTILLCDEKPQLTEPEYEGTWRRIQFMNPTEIIPRGDDFPNEYHGMPFMSLLIKYYHIYKKTGQLIQPKVIKEMNLKYRQ